VIAFFAFLVSRGYAVEKELKRIRRHMWRVVGREGLSQEKEVDSSMHRDMYTRGHSCSRTPFGSGRSGWGLFGLSSRYQCGPRDNFLQHGAAPCGGPTTRTDLDNTPSVHITGSQDVFEHENATVVFSVS